MQARRDPAGFCVRYNKLLSFFCGASAGYMSLYRWQSCMRFESQKNDEQAMAECARHWTGILGLSARNAFGISAIALYYHYSARARFPALPSLLTHFGVGYSLGLLTSVIITLANVMSNNNDASGFDSAEKPIVEEDPMYEFTI